MIKDKYGVLPNAKKPFEKAINSANSKSNTNSDKKKNASSLQTKAASVPAKSQKPSKSEATVKAPVKPASKSTEKTQKSDAVAQSIRNISSFGTVQRDVPIMATRSGAERIQNANEKISDKYKINDDILQKRGITKKNDTKPVGKISEASKIRTAKMGAGSTAGMPFTEKGLRDRGLDQKRKSTSVSSIKNTPGEIADMQKRFERETFSELGIPLHLGYGDTKQNRDYVNRKPVAEYSRDELSRLIAGGTLDLEEIKKINPVLYSRLSYEYGTYMTGGGKTAKDEALLFMDNTKESAADSLEAVGRGVVNTGAAVYNYFAEDEDIDNFIKNNYVKPRNSERFDYMNNSLRIASELIGSSAQLIPTMAVSMINPALGTALIGTQSFGNSYSQGLRDGASKREAFSYALMSSAFEMAVEKYAGGLIGQGKGVTSKYTAKLANSFKSPAMQKLVRLGLEAGGEGMEEVYSYIFEPVFKKLTYAPDMDIKYSAEEVAYNFLGGFVGSAIFGGASLAVGFDNNPAPEAYAEAEKAINAFKDSAFHLGIADAKTQKALLKAEKAIKNASYYDGAENKYVLSPEVAELINATRVVRRNPETGEAQVLIDKFAGVGKTSVIKNEAYKALVESGQISRREARAMDRLAYKFGVNIEFVDPEQFKVNSFKNDGTLYSIETLTDGKKFVKADRQVIHGDDPQKWGEDVKKYINTSIRAGKDVQFTGLDGEVLTITYDTAGKAKFRNYIEEKGGNRRRMNDDEYRVKLNAEAHIDELAQVSRKVSKKNTPDKKKHAFAKDGFSYRNAFFEDFDGQYYMVKISVGHNGEVGTVYNVGRLTNVNKNKSKGGALTPSGGSMAAQPIAATTQQKVAMVTRYSSENSLPQNTSNDNVHNAENMVGDFVESDGFDIAGLLNDVVPNAEYSADGKTIRVSTASKDPFMVSVLHEAVHALKRGNAKQYGILNENLKMFLRTNPKVFSGVIADLAGRYASSDGKVNRDIVDEEFTAKMLSYILDNKKAVKRLARENMNIFEKVQDSVLALSDAGLERYSTLNYGEDSDIAVVAKKLDEYRNEFLDVFVEGGEGYYRFYDYASAGYSINNGIASAGNIRFNLYKSFASQVDDALSPKPKSKMYVHVGSTSNLIQKCGFDSLPVLMTQAHIRDINTPKEKNKPGKSKYHGLSPEQIKHIPEMLKNPVMIYDSISKDSENTVCVLTNEFDGDGLPIIVVFKYAENIAENNVPKHCIVEAGTYNLVASEYGRDDFIAHLDSLIKGNKILYSNKSRIEKFLKSKTLNLDSPVKLQLLERLNKLGFDKIIHQSENLVKKNNSTKNGNGYNSQKSLPRSSNNSVMESNQVDTIDPEIEFYRLLKDDIEFYNDYKELLAYIRKNNINPEAADKKIRELLSEDYYILGLYEQFNPSGKFDISSYSPKDDVDTSTDSIVNNPTIERIFRRESMRYGLGNISVEELPGVSFAQRDIDARLGREFMFEDNSVTSQVKDKLGNSLHLSDTVIFDNGERASVSTGAGRILGFDENANIIIAVDAGTGFGSTATVPADQVTFVMHNTPESIGRDFETSNGMYGKAKRVFDEFIKTGDVSVLDSFGYNNARYYLMASEEKVRTIATKLQKHIYRDDGIGGHVSGRAGTSADSNPYDYDDMSAHDLLRQYYEAVYNMNLAKNISDVYVHTGADVLDVEKMIRSIVDKDSFVPDKVLKRKGGRSGHSIVNGNYIFNDVHRNFERVFGRYYDVVKPLLDEFDDAKGKYALNLTNNISSLNDMMKTYGFKAGDDFDKAIQWYGEGSIHFDLNKAKDRKLFEKLGYNHGNFRFGKEIDVPFGEAELIRFIGEGRAKGVRECSAWFRQAYDTYLERANETISRIYPGQSERLIKPRKDYFRHFKDVSDNLFSLMFKLGDDIQIDPMLAGISNRTKPNQSWESYRQERKTEETGHSAIKGFADYMKQAEYTININPMIKEFRELTQALRERKSELGLGDLTSFLNYLDNFTNHIAKKTILLDRNIIDLGRNARTVLRKIDDVNNKVKKNNIIGNASVALKQILNLKNGVFYLQKPSLLINSVLGLGKAITSDASLMEYYSSLMNQSNYLRERYLDTEFNIAKGPVGKVVSMAEKVAGNITSLGDEFACRAIWLAAFEDAVRLDVPEPVRYADDIARRCSAGRGIGEKPIVFSVKSLNLFLPYLLENNNNWNVWRDFFGNATKSKKGDSHVFSDRNSYQYYRNAKSGKKKFVGNSLKAAFFLLMTAGVGELIEELTGYQAEFNPVNDVMKAIDKSAKDNGGKLSAGSVVSVLGESSKNIAVDFMEHRNFSSLYSLAISAVSDDPLQSNVDFFGSVPAFSVGVNTVKALGEGDIYGAGLEFATGLMTPFGGNQIKKSIKGATDLALGGHYKNSATEMLSYGKKGGRLYDVERSRDNFARGLLFGPSSFPETKEYYENKGREDDASSQNSEVIKSSLEAFEKEFRKKKDYTSKEVWRVYGESDKAEGLPFEYVPAEISYKDRSGDEQTIKLTDFERSEIQNELNVILADEFAKIVKSDKYKNADDDEKYKLLSKARSGAVEDYMTKLKNDYIYKADYDRYIEAHGKDEVIGLINETDDYSLLPMHDFKKKRDYEQGDNKYVFELTDEQASSYDSLAEEYANAEYQLVMNSQSWSTMDKTQKAQALKKAKEKATGKVSEFIKWDYIYKDIIKEFDGMYGEDNPVRRAYEYSHDATVYPDWILDDKVTFSYKKKDYEYVLSKVPGSYDGNESEYDYWQRKFSENMLRNYSDNDFGGNGLAGKSDAEIYEHISTYKKELRSFINNHLKNYCRKKLGIPEYNYK